MISNGCSQLVAALKFWYRYKRKMTGSLDDKPEKSHPWSDLADCLQYMCLSTNANYLGRIMSRRTVHERRPSPSTKAWT